MKIEHAAWNVEDPRAMANWYVENLDMKIVRAGDAPAHARFLADSSGRILVEIYNNPAVNCPDYRQIDPLVLHLAFLSDDVKTDIARLVKAGATVHQDYTVAESGDEMAMLRDPWGFAVQLMKRTQPM